jgi:hypothetical protein
VVDRLWFAEWERPQVHASRGLTLQKEIANGTRSPTDDSIPKDMSARSCAMKSTAILLLVLSAVVPNAAFAQRMNADDLKWVNQCISDNKGGASDAIIRKYCVCMNEKMDNNETRSISEWEKSNPQARAACDKESGWK